jgi:hypothetical protein
MLCASEVSGVLFLRTSLGFVLCALVCAVLCAPCVSAAHNKTSFQDDSRAESATSLVVCCAVHRIES